MEKKFDRGTQAPFLLGEGGGEVGAAHEVAVEAAGGYRKNSPFLYTTFPSVRM